jgi:hypothetical protein
MEFNSKHTIKSDIQIKYNNKTIVNTNELKFLGIVLHNMSWKIHIDMLATKLNKACWIARVIRPFLSLNSLNRVYHVYFHSEITYVIIFWGTSSHSLNIFKLEKQMVRILKKAGARDSCRNFLKTLKILPLASQYILSLALFMVTNKTLFRQHSEIDNFNSRSNSKLQLIFRFRKVLPMHVSRYTTIFQLTLRTWHVILKVLKKYCKIICMSILFIPWIKFLMYKIRVVLLMIILTSLYFYFLSFKINNYEKQAVLFVIL